MAIKDTKAHKKLGELLLEQGLVTEQIIKEALAEQKITRQKLGEILVERSYVTVEQVNCAIASQMGTEAVNIANYIIMPEVLSIVKEDDARKFKVMPLFRTENILYVAMANPNDVFAIDQLQRQSKMKIVSLLASDADLSWAIEQYYEVSGTVEEILSKVDEDKLLKGEKDQEAAIVKLVNIIIAKAVHDGASDIHIEPEEKFVGVRFRIDGMLHQRYVLPKSLQSSAISRVKILSNLDISEKRLPQDGRIRLRIEAKEIDFRVSTCPTVYGENTELRILDKGGYVLGLDSFGFSKCDLEKFRNMISTPYGILLITGPTGSGKTTTLYSALQILNKEEVNILTVEDPVEYEFPRIRQVQVNPEIGLTFAHILRTFLRQDPNIIMVGEIRDLETAEIAVQAALTGHMVFSTLHTNDAPSAFTRLIDMGVEPFLVSSSLVGVVAQRLLRKVCNKCKELYEPSKDLLKSLGLEEKIGSGIQFSRAVGCKDCGLTGYKGRTGIFEVLKVTPAIQEVVLRKESADTIKNQAIKEGMVTLRQAALDKLFARVTTAEEVVRVTIEFQE